MYYLKKTIEIAGAHQLALPYESKCKGLHGHNWLVTIYCRGDGLNAEGMLVDFAEVKRIVETLDHANLNDVLSPLNPTAENIAKWLCDRIPLCHRVEIRETEGNVAVYER